MASTQEFFTAYQKAKEKTSTYINGRKFNMQAGDKQKQSFFLRLMPRIPNKPTELCEGPFHEFWVHRNCGPDNSQALICLNRNREEFKSNKMKCPACTRVRKILNDENSYSPDAVKKAKDQKAQNRVLWAVYDLANRKEIEFMEISGKANDALMDQFQDAAGDFYDLTQIKEACCIKINRTGSGLNSEYSYRALMDKRFVLTSADVPKIKASYKYPELVLVRLDAKEFIEVYESSFAIDSSSQVDGDVMPPAGDLDDLAGNKPEGASSRSRSGANDLDGLSGVGDNKPPKDKQRSGDDLNNAAEDLAKQLDEI